MHVHVTLEITEAWKYEIVNEVSTFYVFFIHKTCKKFKDKLVIWPQVSKGTDSDKAFPSFFTRGVEKYKKIFWPICLKCVRIGEKRTQIVNGKMVTEQKLCLFSKTFSFRHLLIDSY